MCEAKIINVRTGNATQTFSPLPVSHLKRERERSASINYFKITNNQAPPSILIKNPSRVCGEVEVEASDVTKVR